MCIRDRDRRDESSAGKSRARKTDRAAARGRGGRESRGRTGRAGEAHVLTIFITHTSLPARTFHSRDSPRIKFGGTRTCRRARRRRRASSTGRFDTASNTVTGSRGARKSLSTSSTKPCWIAAESGKQWSGLPSVANSRSSGVAVKPTCVQSTPLRHRADASNLICARNLTIREGAPSASSSRRHTCSSA